MVILKENDKVGSYTVLYFIKEGLYNGTYRVQNEEGRSFFMKLYDTELVPEKLWEDGEICEISYSRKIRHDNVISYVDDGSVSIAGNNYKYLITEYFVGSLLSEALQIGSLSDPDVCKAIIIGVLRGLDYLHSELGLCHNDLTPNNIILDKIDDDKYIPRIIDLGHLSPRIFGAPPFPVDDLTPAFCAPETFSGFYEFKGDVFSAMAIYYKMLCGKTPWPCDIAKSEPYAEKKRKIRQARKAELDIEILREKKVPEDIIGIIRSGLTMDSIGRASAGEILTSLQGGESGSIRRASGQVQSERERKDARSGQETSNVEIKKVQGGGFSDVAGMESLKAELTNRVIWVLRDKEKAEKYRLTPPNGMILYGPPGCGKTFFAEKFAEEAQFNFTLVNGSDLGSIYVHGTQGKIADLFREAAKHPPTIICFDEFDSFVPARGTTAAQYRPEEVNEFLGQLNNCSQKGIFVIGTTNRLDMIDPAVLRKGRMDLHVEIPAPDVKTRALIFKIHLKNRPLSEDIDYDELAVRTENYAASDIAFIVNDAAMNAALADEEIGQAHLVHSISCTKSSLSPVQESKKIGF